MSDWWFCPTCTRAFKYWPLYVADDRNHFIVRCNCGQQIIYWVSEL